MIINFLKNNVKKSFKIIEKINSYFINQIVT